MNTDENDVLSYRCLSAFIGGQICFHGGALGLSDYGSQHAIAVSVN
jgi:hypothetical protein